MIIDIVGVPQLSFLEARLLCGMLGIRIGNLRKKQPYFQSFRPTIQSYFGPIRVVYIDDVEVFMRYSEALYEKKQHHVILLNASPSTLKELGIDVNGNGVEPFTIDDLKASFLGIPQASHSNLLSRKTDLAEQIMHNINKESLLGKLQTSFYRVKQVDDRQRMQSLVYAYLSGSIKKMPTLNIPSIDKLVTTELCRRFVTAVSFAKKVGPDEASEKYGIDRFELAYILKRSGHDLI